jgi:hypothetical protein
LSGPGGPCAAAAVARDTTNTIAVNNLVTGNLLVGPRLKQERVLPRLFYQGDTNTKRGNRRNEGNPFLLTGFYNDTIR